MAKSTKPVDKPADKPVEITAKAVAQPSELVIKEIMIQKNVSRDEAINILKNPTR